MTFSQGARHQLAYVAEVTYGTTPATPAMIALRHTNFNVNLTKETFVSNEIRPDRQIVDLRHGTKQVGGDIGFELSYGEFDTMLESALFGAWSTNVLKAGTTLKAFTLEDGFSDVTQYRIFTGCVVNSLSLEIKPNAMVTGTLSFVGNSGSISGTPLDASLTASSTHAPFDGFSGSISEGGSEVATISALELKLENGVTPAFVVGSDTAPQVVAGQSNLTGTVTAYFTNATLLNKFLNETESSISLTLDGASGGDLTILIPRIKYTGGELNIGNANDPVLLTLPFQALRDSTEGTNLKITRTPA